MGKVLLEKNTEGGGREGRGIHLFPSHAFYAQRKIEKTKPNRGVTIEH